jgi:hypothetical protein
LAEIRDQLPVHVSLPTVFKELRNLKQTYKKLLNAAEQEQSISWKRIKRSEHEAIVRYGLQAFVGAMNRQRFLE